MTSPSSDSRRLTDSEWATAQKTCTTKQLLVLAYWRDGYGYKRISIILGIPRDTVRGRIDRALATVIRARYTRDSEAA